MNIMKSATRISRLTYECTVPYHELLEPLLVLSWPKRSCSHLLEGPWSERLQLPYAGLPGTMSQLLALSKQAAQAGYLFLPCPRVGTRGQHRTPDRQFVITHSEFFAGNYNSQCLFYRSRLLSFPMPFIHHVALYVGIVCQRRRSCGPELLEPDHM